MSFSVLSEGFCILSSTKPVISETFFPSQSLDLVLKKLNLTQQKQTTENQTALFAYYCAQLQYTIKNNNNNRFTALCPGLPGWVCTRRNIHPPTILIIIHSLSASFIYYVPWHPPCSNCVLGNLIAQPLSTSFVVWSPPPHIKYTSSPNQSLLFAAHAHTIAACFAAVSILYHLFLVFLSTPYLELCLLPFTLPFTFYLFYTSI